MEGKKKDWFRWVGPGLLVLFLDRLVKWLYLWMTVLPEKVGVDLQFGFFPGAVEKAQKIVQNTGMAFGLFQGKTGTILIVSIILLIGCFFLLRGMWPSGLAPIALSMILGGATGNMIDRLLYGYVLDMFPFFNWFVFNVADVGVVAGAILCGWSLLFRPQDWSKKEQ